MRPGEQRWTGERDLFRARLDQIINMKHELARLAQTIDWSWIDEEIAGCFSATGRPGVPTRFMVGLLLLKQIYALSDEQVCDRWVYDPYFQYFTGAEFFAHEFPHERSGISHWRKRIGGKLDALLAETLRVAHATGALKPQDMARVTVDSTVQPKAVTHPTDAKLFAEGHREARRPSQIGRAEAATILCEARQAGGADGGPLHPCQAVQTGKPRAEVPAHAAGPADPRHHAQGRRRSLPEERVCRALEQSLAHSLAEPQSARSQALFLARPRGRMHRQGQGAQALRVRGQGLHHNDKQALQGRHVRPPRQSVARQSLLIPSPT